MHSVFLLLFFFCVHLFAHEELLPNGCSLIIKHNASGLLNKKSILASDGTPLWLERTTYGDGFFSIEDHALHNGELRYIHKSTYYFDPKGHITKRVIGNQITSYTYDNDKLISITKPDGIQVFYTYECDQLTYISSSDHTIDYTITRSENEEITQFDGMALTRIYDRQGRLISEIFPNNLSIATHYCDERINDILLPSGRIHYDYQDDKLIKVTRLSENGNVLYEHAYGDATETLIKNQGAISYQQLDDTSLLISTPLGENIYRYAPNHVLLSKNDTTYQYDLLDQLITDTEYDSLGNPVDATVNENNQLLSYRNIECVYDKNGNLIKKITPNGTYHYKYDALDRLIEATTPNSTSRYVYDHLDRRLFKIVDDQVTSYLYQDSNELASCKEGQIEQLRIPGDSLHEKVVKSVAIETPVAIYVPIYDLSFNLEALIDTNTDKITFYDLDPFATNIDDMPDITPWIYACKTYDTETHLAYFGKRYYDPTIKRWLTQDPLGRIQFANLYNFVGNEPLRLIDVDGAFWSIAIPLVARLTLKELLTKAAEFTVAALMGKVIADEIQEKINEKRDEEQAEIKKPPYTWEELGTDPAKCPGEGWEWKGSGSPENSKGNWVNPITKEKLHPDLNHPLPKGPHWGYTDPNGNKCDLFLDGTYTWK